MATTLSGNQDVDTSELDALETGYRNNIAVIQAQIDQLEKQNSELVRQISMATVEEAARLRQLYNANQNQISQLKTQLADYKKKMQ